MSYFIKSGNTYKVATKEAMNLHEQLPAGNYTIQKDPFGNLYLEHIGDFTAPSKIYGNATKHTQRIINTFLDRPNQTGVMMTGEKGSGKTLLVKNVSIELAKQGVPTIVINSPWQGDTFNTLLQSIEQPCVVLFDEFEKVYDRDDQENILTLLDGVFPSRKLFMFTCNDKWRVDYHMRNRPGRIYYMIDFKGLDVDFIIEYCNDNLNAKQHIDKICQIAGLFAEFNFDMLKALVEEMNRYNETPAEALRMLNAKPEFDNGTRYNVTIIHNGKVIDKGDRTEVFDGNPLHHEGIEIGFDPDPNDDEVRWQNIKFNHDALVNFNAKDGKFIFEDNGTRVILTKVPERKFFNYDAF